jgi:hypothetical protein
MLNFTKKKNILLCCLRNVFNLETNINKERDILSLLFFSMVHLVPFQSFLTLMFFFFDIFILKLSYFDLELHFIYFSVLDIERRERIIKKNNER